MLLLYPLRSASSIHWKDMAEKARAASGVFDFLPNCLDFAHATPVVNKVRESAGTNYLLISSKYHM